MKQDKSIHSHSLHPIFCNAMLPANTVVKEKCHSPNAPPAPPAYRVNRVAGPWAVSTLDHVEGYPPGDLPLAIQPIAPIYM